LAVQAQANRQDAGIKLEGVLRGLFQAFGLDPRAAFRLVGEQIDGSFELLGNVYLLEAKWESNPVAEHDLLVFRGKIEGKSEFTRGLFVAVNGYTSEARESIVRGKRPSFVMIDGGHLYRVLEGQWPLDKLLHYLVRRLAERGEPYTPLASMDDFAG
jgi:hypothetical protein